MIKVALVKLIKEKGKPLRNEDICPFFKIDKKYGELPLKPRNRSNSTLEDEEEIVLIRGEFDERLRIYLELNPKILQIWEDNPISPFIFK